MIFHLADADITLWNPRSAVRLSRSPSLVALDREGDGATTSVGDPLGIRHSKTDQEGNGEEEDGI